MIRKVVEATGETTLVSEDQALAEIEALGVIVPWTKIAADWKRGAELRYGGILYSKPFLEVMHEAGIWFRFDSPEQEEGTPFSMPMHYEVCPRCEGRGKHDHPAFANGITQSEFDEDPDFKEEYFAGAYDVRCTACKGLRVVEVPDLDALPADLRAAVEEHIESSERVRRQMDAEAEAERRA